MTITACLDCSNSSGNQCTFTSYHYIDTRLVIQTKVALDRIETYLDEDEVTDQVSSLKTSNVGPRALDNQNEGLGIENGTFTWNAVEEDNQPEVKTPSGEVTITETGSESIEESTEYRFELKDITINFPEGKLTCITGPTASGKTALLVCFISLGVSRWLIIHRSDGAPWRDDHSPRWTDHYV